MDHSRAAARRGRDDDRIGKLSDGVLGHILSFLPSKEAARAAALSVRWRDVFASVHTVSLEQPEAAPSPDPYAGLSYSPGYGPPVVPAPPFANGVSAALLARHRHRRRGAGPPLRALLIAFDAGVVDGANDNGSMVDQWISYAMQQCGPELHLDLRLRGGQICGRRYSLRGAASGAKETHFEEDERRSSSSSNDDSGDDEAPRHTHPSVAGDGAISDDETPPQKRPLRYTLPRGVFSCAALRTLCLGPCKLDPPAGGATSLPSLQTLLLTGVADSGRKVQRLIAGCPRLSDLTLEACARVTALSVLDNKRLRRLALRCCHGLASVAIDASELRAFEYRGAVPAQQPPFLTMHHGPPRSMSSCMVDLCGEELTSEEDLAALREFLNLFASAEHLHLTSARLGAGIDSDTFARFPAFSTLLHLELTGCLPSDDDTAVVAAVARILENAPNVEVLTLFFKALPRYTSPHEPSYHVHQEVLDAHNLRYDGGPPPPTATVPPCLRSRVREINLVHYQGGDAQRMLAKFLLGSAARLDALFCGFAEGPLWIQTKLMDEIREWARDKIEPGEMMFL